MTQICLQPLKRSGYRFETDYPSSVTGIAKLLDVVTDKGTHIQYEINLHLRQEVAQVALETAGRRITGDRNAKFLSTVLDKVKCGFQRRYCTIRKCWIDFSNLAFLSGA